MNPLFVPNYYCSLFLLCPHESKAFCELFQEDEALEETIQNCSEFWRNTLRREFPDHIVCRQRFIQRTILKTVKCDTGIYMTPSLCRAISFAMADLVERRVTELDAEKMSSWCN
jgi:hypothetical protein